MPASPPLQVTDIENEADEPRSPDLAAVRELHAGDTRSRTLYNRRPTLNWQRKPWGLGPLVSNSPDSGLIGV